jgi:hypothetical protein
MSEIDDPRVDVCIYCLPPHRVRHNDVRCARKGSLAAGRGARPRPLPFGGRGRAFRGPDRRPSFRPPGPAATCPSWAAWFPSCLS